MPTNKVDDFLFENESYKVRGACFAVYKILGGGIKEKIIEKALMKELENTGLSIETQKRIDILYNKEKIGVYIPDIVVNQNIMIELKSKPFITTNDEKQFWGYLKGSEYTLGFLVNFGTQQLTIKRFVHTKR